jgi:replicative superfamily II helicase
MVSDIQLTTWLSLLHIDTDFELFKEQIEVVAHIMEDHGVLAVLPTGMGKTILAVIASAYAKYMKRGRKTLFMAPLRALTAEHVDTFSQYGIKALLDNGEHPKAIEDYEKGDYDVVISTFEKMDSIIRQFDERRDIQRRDVVFSQFEFIIIDEIHTVEDENRGVNLESFIMSAKYLYPVNKLMGLSATIGNANYFAQWLGVDLVLASKGSRIVPLIIRYNIITAFSYEDQFAQKFGYLNDDFKSHKGQKRMIAVTAVNRTTKLVHMLTMENPRENLPLEYFMRKHRIAWHYSGNRGMSEEERLAVEWSFEYESLPDEEQYWFEGQNRYINRKAWLMERFRLDHGIDTIVCTPTLIVGRNLPVTYIDIFDHIQYTYRNGPNLISPSRLQQTIGRAGRLKFAKRKDGSIDPNYKGIATIYIPERDYDEMKHRAEDAFDIKSRLRERLGEKILAWINSRIVMKVPDIVAFARTSLDETLQHDVKLLEKKLNFLKSFKFVEEFTDGNLSVTKKGLKTIKYYIQPESVVQWGKLVKKYYNEKNFTRHADLILGVMNVEEFYSDIVVLQKDVAYVNAMASHLNVDTDITTSAVKAFMFSFPSYTREKLEIDEKEYIIPNEESLAVRENFKRLISAFADIYQDTNLYKSAVVSQSMIESGIFDPKLGEMMSIRGIGSAYAIRLIKGDIDTKEKFIEAYKTRKFELMKIMQISVNRLAKIIEDLHVQTKPLLL